MAKKGDAPKQIDPGKAMGEYMFGKGFGNFQGVTDPRLQEKIISAEETYRPRYTALELADIGTMARGTADTPGLFDLLSESSERAGELQTEQLQKQREADVAALQEFSPQIVEAYRTADPYSTEMAELQSDQARELYGQAASPLSPERRRLAEQAARAGSLARGRIGDESSVAQEILGREQFKSFLRGEARQAGQLAFGENRALAGDIGSVLLGRPSQSIGLGGGILGQAQQGAAGQMGPQLFDPNVGINMALQQRGQDVSFQNAQNALKGQVLGSMIQGGASIGAAYAGG